MIDFLPNLLSAILILLIGWLLATVAARLLRRILVSARIDSLAQRRGVTNTLREVGIDVPLSTIVGAFTFWLILLLMLEPLAEALRLTYISHLVSRLLGYVPTVLAAGVLLLLGLSLSRFIANSVERSARAASLEYAGALAILVRYFLSLVVIIITLAQLGVQTAILTVIFAVVLLSIGTASALAFGIGSRAVVANILAGAFIRDHFPAGREIEVHGVRGKVLSVNAVGTNVDSDGRVVTLPNSVLMENVVE